MSAIITPRNLINNKLKIVTEKFGNGVNAGEGTKIEVDDYLSTTSMNPVQNNTITLELQKIEKLLNKLDQKISTYVIDDNLSLTSVNPVQNAIVTTKVKQLEQFISTLDQRLSLINVDLNNLDSSEATIKDIVDFIKILVAEIKGQITK